MKKNKKNMPETTKPTKSVKNLEKEVKDFYEKLGLSSENANASVEFSFFDKVDVFYSSCAGV